MEDQIKNEVNSISEIGPSGKAGKTGTPIDLDQLIEILDSDALRNVAGGAAALARPKGRALN